MNKYRELVNKIPEGGDFWKDHAGDVYAEALQSMVESGWSEESAIEFLRELYEAAASCYGA